MRSVVILAFVLFYNALFSQNSISEVLNSLPEIRRESKKTLIPLKVMLSCDFNRCISGGYVGISDPRMDSARSYQQAYLRALSIFGLQNAMARGMSDFFNDASRGSSVSNYEEFCELKAAYDLPILSIKVSNAFRLKSGETILTLEIDSTNKQLTERLHFNSSVELYNKETQVDGNSRTATKITIKNTSVYSGDTKGHTEVLTYFLSNNRWISQESVFDSLRIDNSQYKLFYVTDIVCPKDTTEFEDKAFGTTDGLWFAFANSIYKELSSQLKPQFLNVKQVGDNYKDKLTSLNRESGFFRFNTTLTSGVYFENKLYSKIKTKFTKR